MSSAEWIEISFQMGSDIRHVYSASEAAELIADGHITPQTKLTAFAKDGPQLVVAGSMSQMPFSEPESPLEEPAPATAPAEVITDTATTYPAQAMPSRRDAKNAEPLRPVTNDAIVSSPRTSERVPERIPPPPPAHDLSATPMIFMALRRYAVFSGRASRAEYWMFQLLVLLCFFGLLIVSASVRDDEMAILTLLALVGLIVPSLSVSVRRFHDLDMSGWFVLFGLIPYVGWLIVSAFALIEGTRGPNKYGPLPP